MRAFIIPIELLHGDDDSLILVLRKCLGQLEKILGVDGNYFRAIITRRVFQHLNF